MTFTQIRLSEDGYKDINPSKRVTFLAGFSYNVERKTKILIV